GIYVDAARNIAGSRTAIGDTSFPNLTLSNPFGAADPNSLLEVSTPKILAIDPGRRTPYTTQFLFNVQRQITQDTMVEVGYLGSRTRKLQSWEPVNEPAPSAVGSPQARAPFPELSVQSWMIAGNG